MAQYSHCMDGESDIHEVVKGVRLQVGWGSPY